jgi:hypothetical protein
MYGFDTRVIVSNVNRRRKANRLPRTITKPVKVNQLRKMERRDGRWGFGSLLIVNEGYKMASGRSIRRQFGLALSLYARGHIRSPARASGLFLTS